LGYLGVDVFFVISGYVVTPLILRIFTEDVDGNGYLVNLKRFYTRRFYRLAPALSVTLAISSLVFFLIGPTNDHQRFARQGIATLLLMGNLGAYKYSWGDYFNPTPNPLVHTWSLSVEEQIYVFLPLILLMILPSIRNLKKAVVVIMVILMAISFISFMFPILLSPIYSRYGIQVASQFSFYSPIDRVWQFLLGGLGFLLQDRYQVHIRTRSSRRNLVSISTIFIVLFAPIYLDLKISSILASLFTLVAIALKSLNTLPNCLSNKLEWLGDRSYSIYLVHLPLIYIARYSPIMQVNNLEKPLIQTTIAVTTSVLLGAISYSAIENRFRYIGQENFTGFKLISATLALTLLIPLALFLTIDKGSKSQYWGLGENLQRPAYAQYIDTKCLRIEEALPCSYLNLGGAKTVLLIGDSHAGHISQAFIDAARVENWNAVVWVDSCQIQFSRSDANSISENCLEKNLKMKSWILKNKPDAIIVSQYVHSSSSQTDLRKALTTLHRIVPNILLVENNPIFPRDPFNWTMLSTMMQISPPKQVPEFQMIYTDKNASDNLAKWSKGNGILTVNFESLFCQLEVCHLYSNSGWLYYDDDHFSIAGARLTIPQLRKFLIRF